MERELTIGRVAKKAGVNIQTVRYYERRKLVQPSRYRDSGYRLYTEEAVRKILFIKNAQALGFSLAEIGSLLRLRAGKSVRCDDIRRKAETHRQDVRERIHRLESIERILGELIRTCQRRGKSDDCPILRSLEVKR